MTKIKGYGMHKCDFCEDQEYPCEMFSCENTWERLEDGRDRCVECLIKDRDYWKKKALKAEKHLK